MNKADFVNALISALNNSEYNWCIPSGYHSLPDSVTSDIDIVVSEKPLKVAKYLAEYFTKLHASWKFVQYYEGKNCFCIFAAVNDGKLDIVSLDLFQHYYYEGKKMIDGKLFLTKTRQCDAIFIPSIKAEFIYIFLKKVLRKKLSSSEASYLSSLYEQDRSGCLSMLFSYFSRKDVELVQKIIKGDNSAVLQLYLKKLQENLLYKGLKSFSAVYCCYKLLFIKLWKRLKRKPGIEVICLGPDGSGKSTAIKELEKVITPILNIQKYHLRVFPPKSYNNMSTKQTSPHQKPAYGFIFSFIKLLSYVILFWFGRLFITSWKKLRAKLIIMDRSFHDVQIDPRRFRMKVPLVIIKKIARLFPKPDLFFIFDAPTELIQVRKQEVSFAETDQQRQLYKLFKSEYKNAFIINTNLPVRTVASQMNRILLAHMAERVKRRLKIRDV